MGVIKGFMEIKTGLLDNSKVISLLTLHHNDMCSHSPVESVHALDINQLKEKDIEFLMVWFGKDLAGCGALKLLDDTHGEIKSMRTNESFLRKGVAAFCLTVLIDSAKNRGLKRLSLETGSMAVFLPARKMYERFGFTECEPFADYQVDPYSTFMTVEL